MKIFIIHSGSDFDKVSEIKEKIHEKTSADLLVLLSKGEGNSWKKEAKSKIKSADLILFMLGSGSYSSPNINFELEVALKHKKQILLVRLNPDKKDLVNEVLYVKDKYMNTKALENKKPLFKELDINDLTKFIKYGYSFDISDKLDDTFDPKRTNEIIEQYKVYLETSEQVLNRRQSTSNFYTTLNTTILTLGSTISAVIYGLDILKNNVMIASILYAIISLFGILLCINWMSLLESYGRLNSAKIKVLSEIEKRLPVNIYDTEWKVMSEKLGSTKYVSFTSLEKRIPLIFMIIYSLIIILCITAIIVFNII